MGKRDTIKLKDLPEFDAAEYLTDKAAMAHYLTLALEDGDAHLLAAVLGDIAKAHGMTEISRATGLSREALYKALRPNAQPRLDTINRVCKALGVRLVAVPESPAAPV
jgi:probable addiction module antidote protein